MTPAPREHLRRVARVGWALVSWWIVESAIFAVALLPAAVFWLWHARWGVRPEWVRIVVLGLSLVPAYILFAVSLMALSAGACRALGWRSPDGARMPISALEWPLLRWARYSATTHIVRVFAGIVLRSTPLWTAYLRMNGARVGRGVWVNSLGVMDHNLLELGDGAVIGSDAHVAGHTIEGGTVRTARVRIGRGATIGIGSVIGIGVTVGDGAQVGALSVVPKNRAIEPGTVVAGAPAHRIDSSPP